MEMRTRYSAAAVLLLSCGLATGVVLWLGGEIDEAPAPLVIAKAAQESPSSASVPADTRAAPALPTRTEGEPNAAAEPGFSLPRNVDSMFHRSGFEWTGTPLTAKQLESLAAVGKSLGNQQVVLGTQLHDLMTPILDRVFESQDSVNVAVQMGTIKRVASASEPLGEGPRRTTEYQTFYRHGATGHGGQMYGGWLYIEDHPSLAEVWRKREEIRGEIKRSIAGIAGPAVRMQTRGK
ncbi:MAG: hypothetical protein Q7T30_03755 [Planctomycetota bacterium]|nr:hypothetical protein [Planctomycetota bacterium]